MRVNPYVIFWTLLADPRYIQIVLNLIYVNVWSICQHLFNSSRLGIYKGEKVYMLVHMIRVFEAFVLAHLSAWSEPGWWIWCPNLCGEVGNSWDYTSWKSYICTWECWIFNLWCTPPYGGIWRFMLTGVFA